MTAFEVSVLLWLDQRSVDALGCLDCRYQAYCENVKKLVSLASTSLEKEARIESFLKLLRREAIAYDFDDREWWLLISKGMLAGSEKRAIACDFGRSRVWLLIDSERKRERERERGNAG